MNLVEVENGINDDIQKQDCPDTLYMGGSAYSVNMLKRRGCPKLANYNGVW